MPESPHSCVEEINYFLMFFVTGNIGVTILTANSVGRTHRTCRATTHELSSYLEVAPDPFLRTRYKCPKTVFAAHDLQELLIIIVLSQEIWTAPVNKVSDLDH